MIVVRGFINVNQNLLAYLKSWYVQLFFWSLLLDFFTKQWAAMTAINETNKKYGRLTVIKRAENKDKKAMWHCICDCGTPKIVSGTHLRTKHVQSCGCYHAEVVAQIGKSNKNKKHKRGKPRLYEN